jgi:hypothetical protein
MPAHLWKDFLDKCSVYEFSVNAWCLYFFQEGSVRKKTSRINAPGMFIGIPRAQFIRSAILVMVLRSYYIGFAEM